MMMAIDRHCLGESERDGKEDGAIQNLTLGNRPRVMMLGDRLESVQLVRKRDGALS